MPSTTRSADLRASVKSGTKGTSRFWSWILRRYLFVSFLKLEIRKLLCAHPPHIIRSCLVLGNRLMACSHNALNDVQQRVHLLLYFRLSMLFGISRWLYKPLFPGPHTTRTFLPLLIGWKRYTTLTHQ